MKKLNNDWDAFLEIETKKEYYLELREFLKKEYREKTIYPEMNNIYNALKLTPLTEVKVVILGQDPYINKGEAHGLSFSVQKGVKIPPSLNNVFKEISTDVGCYIPNNGYLCKWAEQGVLLLNTVLTVEAKRSKSHANKGWEKFTNNIISYIDEKDTPVVFLLWGRDAQNKEYLITNTSHKVLKAAHPSPLAGGKFFGCEHFSKTNEFLKNNNLKSIDWQIDNI